MDAPVQKHRLIARKIIFIVPPVPPGPKSGGGTMSRVARYLHTQRRTPKIKKEDKALQRRTEKKTPR